MSVISRSQAPIAGQSAIRHDSSGAIQRAASGLLMTSALVCAIALIVSGILLAYGLAHSDTIFSGTRAAGIHLGGMTEAQAERRLEARFDRLATQPIVLAAGDLTLATTPEELGVEFDAQQTAGAAYRFGRQSNLWVDTRNWLDALSNGHRVEPVMTLDKETFATFLHAHTRDLVRAPVEPSFSTATDGTVEFKPGVPGLAVDVNETFERFQDHLGSMTGDAIEIATVPVAPSASDDVYQAGFDRVQQLAGQPLRLELDGNVWEIGTSDLLSMLDIGDSDEGIDVTLDQNMLRNSVRSLESQVFTPGTDARVWNENGTFVTSAAVAGHKLDVDNTVEAVIAALENGEARADIATRVVQPNITDEQVAEAKITAERLVSKSINLTWGGGNAAIAPDKLTTVVRFDVNPARNPKIAVTLDEPAVQQLLGDVANSVKVEAKNAELRWIDGQVNVRTPEQPGREMDLSATVNQILAAMHDGTDTIVVVTKDVKPEVTAEMAAGIQFPDKLATGQTHYGDSAPNRYLNVELATSRVNGAMVPPGGLFSFNQAVGEVTINSGYKTGYGIIATNGSISTVPSVGGGICQVATTVFHAAFRSGMPIEKRSWHLYWIPRYGQPPSGMKGLDATVDPDYDLDFLFRNATNNWIAIKGFTDGQYVNFEIWGTNPGWEVVIDQPQISNIRPASQQMFYEQSDELPAGTSVFVEHAEDGFDSRIHRVVKKDGQVIDEVTLVSTYEPARNVTLVGTG